MNSPKTLALALCVFMASAAALKAVTTGSLLDLATIFEPVRVVPSPIAPVARAVAPQSAPSAPRPVVLSARASDSTHQAQCARTHGSFQNAVSKCARCKWIKHKAKWLARCIFIDVSGFARPWLEEQPDACKPWGLGCCLCAWAVRGERPGVQPCSFAFHSVPTDASHSINIEDVLRHGNLSKGQQRGKLMFPQ